MSFLQKVGFINVVEKNEYEYENNPEKNYFKRSFKVSTTSSVGFFL